MSASVILVFGLAGLTLANFFGALTLGTRLFVVTDVLASICVVAVLPMCVATVTLIFPLAVRPLVYGSCSDPSARRLSWAPPWEAYSMPWVSRPLPFSRC